MKVSDLNKIPEELSKNRITTQQALNRMAIYVIQNYPVFGLHKYDEDFRSDLILSLLEKGEKLFTIYDPQLGDFFNYFFCYVLNLVRTRAKILVRKNLYDNITVNECINELDEKLEQYEQLEASSTENSDAKTQAVKTRTIKDIFSGNNLEDKTILLLALKSAYYLNDNQIDKICTYFSLEKNDLYSTIQNCKKNLEKKANRRKEFEERRNNAYFRHRKYALEQLKNSDEPSKINENQMIYKKDLKQTANWKLLNKKLENGFLYLRPTNKTLATMVGICERQVSYYLNTAKKIEKKEK